MINLKQIYSKVTKTPNLMSESKISHFKHLFQDGTLTFDDMRNVFNSVFSGKTTISKKVNKIPLFITYKDGEFAIANDDNSVKEPFSIDKVCAKCKCSGLTKDAVANTLTTFMKPLYNMQQTDLNSIFANGQNYYSIDLVIPPEKYFKDYNNKCFIQCNKVKSYDSTFKNIVEDDTNTTKLAEYLNLNKDVDQSNDELSKDCINKLKQSTSPDAALKMVLDALAKIVDGIGYKATVNDYVRERYAKHIVNVALQKGIDLYHNSDFVNELIARLSYVANHKPNRADLITYAKRDGVNWKCPEYRELIDQLESVSDQTNDEIIKPIEQLVLLAGVLIMKCFIGLVASDPRHSVRKLLLELESTIQALETDDVITPEKIKIFRHCMKNLDQYQTTLPEDGIMFMYKGKVYNLKGKFGAINNIMKLMNY